MKMRFWASALLALPTFAGCHSYHIETTVENKTCAEIRLLEVDYPTASFGSDCLASGVSMHYRIQARGDGALKVQYTGADGKQAQTDGPILREGQEGKLDIVLLPGGKVEFHPALTPAR